MENIDKGIKQQSFPFSTGSYLSYGERFVQLSMGQ